MNALKQASLLSICLLTACTTPTLPPESPTENMTPPPHNHDKKQAHVSTSASTITSWTISGAMAARNRNKGWNASMNWTQRGAHQYQIRLFGPLGGGTVVIEKNNGVVTYVDGPKRATARSADELLYKQTGIRLPVQNLYYWVRGMPAPGATPAAHYDSAHHLERLNQAGYTISYNNYTSVGQVDLPQKITLQGHGVVVKVVIKRWQVL